MADKVTNLIRRIKRYDAQKVDVVEPAAALQYTGETYTMDGEPIKVTPTAVRQLFYIAKIPYEFYTSRLSLKERVSIFNRIFSKEIGNNEYMFRMANNELYGIVSARYGKMDNVLIVDLIREAVKAGFKLHPVKSVLDPDHTKISLITEVDPYTGLAPGFFFSNSENGLGSLQIHAGVWRLVCSNGLLVSISGTKSRWIHIGECEIDAPDFVRAMEVSMDYTRCLEEARGNYLNLKGKVHILRSISNNLGQRVAAEFVHRANLEYHGSQELYSAINALTAAAHSFSPIQETAIEQYASTLLH